MQFISEFQVEKELCDSIIKLHQTASERGLVSRGKLGIHGDYKVDTNLKDSYDLGLVMVPDDLAIEYRIPDFYQELKNCFDQYVQQHDILKNLGELELGESPIIQHYKPGGGFKYEHFERSNIMSTRRVLVWMMYLNDVTDEGGTHFVYQDYTATPEKGKLLIWPTDFTHTHKGVVSPTQDKYIITGWLSFAMEQ